MNKLGFAAVTMISIAMVVGIASAQPAWKPANAANMTQEEKDLRIQVLELQQQMLQDRIAYLKGEMTQEQLQESQQAHMETMKTLMEQLKETTGNSGSCPGWQGKGNRFGKGMMRGY